jgi:hypothetical protein
MPASIVVQSILGHLVTNQVTGAANQTKSEMRNLFIKLLEMMSYIIVAMLLVGVGLLGIAGVSRRRNK